MPTRRCWSTIHNSFSRRLLQRHLTNVTLPTETQEKMAAIDTCSGTYLRSADRGQRRSIPHVRRRRSSPSHPREALHPFLLQWEKRVHVECPSQCRGTSCARTNQEFEPRACTTDSGTVLGSQMCLCDSTGSGVAVPAVCSHQGAQPPVLRLPPKPPAL